MGKFHLFTLVATAVATLATIYRGNYLEAALILAIAFLHGCKGHQLGYELGQERVANRRSEKGTSCAIH